jgi:nucleoside-diphosphate-sugar epimerase
VRVAAKHSAVLVTGAHGFIGTRLARRLRAAGHSVRGLVRRDEEVPGVELVSGDIADPEVLREAVAGMDAIVHTVACFHDDFAEARRVNVLGTRLLAQAALRAGCGRFVHLSTCGTYALTGLDLVDETTPLWEYDEGSPLVYGVTKAEAERVLWRAAADGLPLVVLRPPNVLGADLLSTWGYHVALAIRDGKVELGGDGGNTWPFVHVENLLDAIGLALEHPNAVGEAFTVVDGHTTWAEYTGRFAAWLGAELHRREPREPYDTFMGRFSSEKVRTELGYSPRLTYEDAMRETRLLLRVHGVI